jgi:hypothetical protein
MATGTDLTARDRWEKEVANAPFLGNSNAVAMVVKRV